MAKEVKVYGYRVTDRFEQSAAWSVLDKDWEWDWADARYPSLFLLHPSRDDQIARFRERHWSKIEDRKLAVLVFGDTIWTRPADITSTYWHFLSYRAGPGHAERFSNLIDEIQRRNEWCQRRSESTSVGRNENASVVGAVGIVV